MNTRKFEYLETIRETIELGDYEEVDAYVETIKDAIRFDTDFEDILMEISTGKYQDVIPLIDDIIYKEMQEDYEGLDQAEADNEDDGIIINDFSLEFETDEDIREEISFESFDDNGYQESGDEDNFM